MARIKTAEADNKNFERFMFAKNQKSYETQSSSM